MGCTLGREQPARHAHLVEVGVTRKRHQRGLLGLPAEAADSLLAAGHVGDLEGPAAHAVGLGPPRIEFDFGIGDRLDQAGTKQRRGQALRHHVGLGRHTRLHGGIDGADLQRMEGARRRWIADMSHELRTPLTGLRGEIEALADGVRPLTPAALLFLREDVLRLSALSDDLHLLAMADLHSLPCRFADADAVDTVRAALQRFAARAAAAGLSLAWAVPPPAALPVCWDSARIGQLLANLLENSLRYTDAPGRIALTLQRSGNSLRQQPAAQHRRQCAGGGGQRPAKAV